MRKHYSKNEERTQPDGRSSYGKAHREIIASALAATIPCYCTCEVQYGVAVCLQEADFWEHFKDVYGQPTVRPTNPIRSDRIFCAPVARGQTRCTRIPLNIRGTLFQETVSK